MTTATLPNKLIIQIKNLWRQLVELGFSLLYNELAWTYDTVSWIVSFGTWRDWQLTTLPYVCGHHVLEIAHGPGHMLLALDEAGYQVTGIDISTQMNKIAGKRINDAGKSIPLLISSAQDLPFPQETFDSILATFPTEFIIDSRTLNSVYRALNKNGLFIIVLGARLVGEGYLVKIIEFLYRLTGQRSDFALKNDNALGYNESYRQNLQDFYGGRGFELEIESIPLKNSVVTLLLARKKIGG